MGGTCKWINLFAMSFILSCAGFIMIDDQNNLKVFFVTLRIRVGWELYRGKSFFENYIFLRCHERMSKDFICQSPVLCKIL